MKASTEIDIATIGKNSAEVVKVRLSDYGGAPSVDLRSFVVFGDNPDPRPTKKGINLRVERIDELVEALTLAKAEACRLGLLSAENKQESAAQNGGCA